MSTGPKETKHSARKGKVFITYVFFIQLLAIANCAVAEDAEKGGIRGAWLTYWDAEKGVNSRLLPLMSDVYYFAAHLNSSGLAVNDSHFQTPILGIHKHRAWLTIVNDIRADKGSAAELKNADIVHKILSNTTLAQAHIDSILKLADSFDGIDLDYENLNVDDRTEFSLFVDKLAKSIHAQGKQISITVQPKRGESRSKGPGAADWEFLCSKVDRFQIMLYNQHSAKSTPGPIAELEWLGAIMNYAASKCDKEKIIPIIKVSGMRWGGGSHKGMQYDEVIATRLHQGVKLKRTENSFIPYFEYDEEGKHNVVYYEDAKSISAKLQYLEKLGFRSFIFWSLGREDPMIYQIFP